MLSINTNAASLFAQNSLSGAQSSLAASVQRLSSGLRINSAADDAAGLSISKQLQAQINGINGAIQDLNDAINVSQTAESGLSSIQDIMLQMKELATQGFNGALSVSQRTDILTQLQDLNAAMNDIAQKTKFNGISLLTNNLASQSATSSATVSGFIDQSTSPISLDPTNGFQLTIGSNTYKTTDSAINGKSITALGATGLGGVTTLTDLNDWVNHLSTTLGLGITSSVTNPGSTYTLNISGGTQNIATAGIFSNSYISGFSSATAAIDLSGPPFSLTVDGTAHNNPSATNLSQLNAWIQGLNLSGVSSQIVGSGSNYSLLVSATNNATTVSMSGITPGGGGGALSITSPPNGSVATASITPGQAVSAGTYNVNIPWNTVTISGFQTAMDELNMVGLVDVNGHNSYSYGTLTLGGVTYETAFPNAQGNMQQSADPSYSYTDYVSGTNFPYSYNATIYDLARYIGGMGVVDPGSVFIRPASTGTGAYYLNSDISDIKVLGDDGVFSLNSPLPIPHPNQNPVNNSRFTVNSSVDGSSTNVYYNNVLFDPSNSRLPDPTDYAFTYAQNPFVQDGFDGHNNAVGADYHSILVGPLNAGDSVTIGGAIFTATDNLNAQQVADAFINYANSPDYPTTLADPTYGTFGGSHFSSDWSPIGTTGIPRGDAAEIEFAYGSGPITFSSQGSNPDFLTLDAYNGDKFYTQTIDLTAIKDNPITDANNQMVLGLTFDNLGVNILLDFDNAVPGGFRIKGSDLISCLIQNNPTMRFTGGHPPELVFNCVGYLSDFSIGAFSLVGNGPSDPITYSQTMAPTDPLGTVTYTAPGGAPSHFADIPDMSGVTVGGLTINPANHGSTSFIISASGGVPYVSQSESLTSQSVLGSPSQGDGSLDFQAGATADFHVKVNTVNVLTNSDGSAAQMQAVGNRLTQAGAGNLQGLTQANSLQTWQTGFKNLSANLDDAINYISDLRTYYGSKMNTIDFNVQNLRSQLSNSQAANSDITETEYALETSKMTKGQIMMQANTAVLAQANQAPSMVLNLLSTSFSNNYDIRNFA